MLLQGGRIPRKTARQRQRLPQSRPPHLNLQLKRRLRLRRKKSIEEYEKSYLKKRMREDVERPICPICNEPIYIIEEAIRHNASGELAHFECILNEIKENNISDMEEEDKIVYLGSGTFGIIQERQNGKNTRFFVRKRINYENRKVKRIEDDADPEEEDLFNV